MDSFTARFLLDIFAVRLVAALYSVGDELFQIVGVYPLDRTRNCIVLWHAALSPRRPISMVGRSVFVVLVLFKNIRARQHLPHAGRMQ